VDLRVCPHVEIWKSFRVAGPGLIMRVEGRSTRFDGGYSDSGQGRNSIVADIFHIAGGSSDHEALASAWKKGLRQCPLARGNATSSSSSSSASSSTAILSSDRDRGVSRLEPNLLARMHRHLSHIESTVE
jgi:hypothetical protein